MGTRYGYEKAKKLETKGWQIVAPEEDVIGDCRMVSPPMSIQEAERLQRMFNYRDMVAGEQGQDMTINSLMDKIRLCVELNNSQENILKSALAHHGYVCTVNEHVYLDAIDVAMAVEQEERELNGEDL